MASKSIEQLLTTSKFYQALGVYVVSVSNNETLFLGILKVMLNDNGNAGDIVWYSQRSTVARLELLVRLFREQFTSKEYKHWPDQIHSLATRFKKLSGQRNFYCHAAYVVGDMGEITHVQGATLQQDGEPLKLETKRLTKGTLNEIEQTLDALRDLNVDIWDFIDEFQKRLGVRIEDIQRPQRATQEALDAHRRQSKELKRQLQRQPSPR